MGVVKKAAGPLVVADGMKSSAMYDLALVSKEKLLGEIIELHGETASIQVYEETSGIKAGDIVSACGEPLSAELGPGLIGSIYDGIQRPLSVLFEENGDRLQRGATAAALSRDKLWLFSPKLSAGDAVCGGTCIGTVCETNAVVHKIMVPHGICGKILDIKSGEYTVTDTICEILCENGEKRRISMLQRWPVRKGRPYKKKLPAEFPLITGQRVIDTLFPIAKGGIGAVPGPFGSGKTVVQHQLAKWAECDIVVYIGCGERGNEMTDVLNEFPEIKKNGKTIMEKTVLIANTSDMPVAAREASIYTGMTIAEYFRDMGYSVLLLADSTSRWAEALREMSGRLAEIPGEEGYPAYLASRLAGFYERAGRVETCGEEEGTLTVVGAVSPQGGDISEPVSQATLRIVRVFWNLDSELAYRRHFPAINWQTSYSMYFDRMRKFYEENVGEDWTEVRNKIILLLAEEAELSEVSGLVGKDALSAKDLVKLETARMVREDFLHQNAFHEQDMYTSLKKQLIIVRIILDFYSHAVRFAENGGNISQLAAMDAVQKIGRMKYQPEERCAAEAEEIRRMLSEELGN